MRKSVIIGVVSLVVGLLVGWFAGRFMLERYWSTPFVLERLAAADVQPSSGQGADPTPPVGALVLRPTPHARARLVLAELTRRDPLVATLGNVATGNAGSQLSLELKNRGTCAISAFSGVAYGFDAYGKPSRMNKGGEHYVAFSEKNVTGLGPNAVHALTAPLHNVTTASLVVAHVDDVVCADGTHWARPTPNG